MSTTGAAILMVEAGQIDLQRRRVLRNGSEISLTTLEVNLLVYLVERSGQPVSTDALLVDVWGYKPGLVSRAPFYTVRRLRQKIETDPANPRHLLTEYSLGYQFVPLESNTPSVAPLASSPSPWVGRQAELQRMLDWWSGSGRLLTLVGPTGVGKTALASLFRGRLGPKVSARWIDLTEATDAIAACEAATAQGMNFLPDVDPSLAGHPSIEERGVSLLILDNVDTAIPSVRALISDWGRTPDLPFRVLVTSPIRLGMPGEAVLDVPGLDADDGRALYQRLAAQRGAPADSEAAIDSLVAELEGLPLGIELAASRSTWWRAEQTLDRLRAGVNISSVLTNRHPRHQSLLSAIDWMWDQLTRRQQEVLAKCGLFRGDFSAEALAATNNSSAEDDLVILCERSLVRVCRPGRFVLPQMVSIYVQEKLKSHPDRERWEAAQIRWYLDRLAPARDNPHGRAWVVLLRWIGDEISNLRHIASQLQNADPAWASSVEFLLAAWFTLHFQWPSVEHALERAHALAPPEQQLEIEVRQLTSFAGAQRRERALKLLERMPLYTTDKPQGLLRWWITKVVSAFPDTAAALEMSEQALGVARRFLPDRVPECLVMCAHHVVRSGDPEKALRYLQAALQEAGPCPQEIFLCGQLAVAAWSVGDATLAKRALERRTQAMLRDLGCIPPWHLPGDLAELSLELFGTAPPAGLAPLYWRGSTDQWLEKRLRLRGHLWEGSWDRAEGVLSQLTHPNVREVRHIGRLGRSILERQQGRLAEAERLLVEDLNEPGLSDIRRQRHVVAELALLLWLRGAWDEGIRVVQSVPHHPSSAVFWRQMVALARFGSVADQITQAGIPLPRWTDPLPTAPCFPRVFFGMPESTAFDLLLRRIGVN